MKEKIPKLVKFIVTNQLPFGKSLLKPPSDREEHFPSTNKHTGGNNHTGWNKNTERNISQVLINIQEGIILQGRKWPKP